MKQIAQHSARLDLDRASDSVTNAQTALNLAESNVRARASGNSAVSDGAGPRSSATGKVAKAVVDIVKITAESINSGEGCASIFDDFVSSASAASDKYVKEPGLSLIKSCITAKQVETGKAQPS
ncbi:hypothetical protein [Massilia sp. TWR1-2-2]|uniref:hypothetical protein n=1 Tax=Massilia sp. TWR1-2-2 TaxID=2804584 RepID=UPI003CEBCCDB